LSGANHLEPLVHLDKDAETFPKLLVRKAAELGSKTALREKEFGIWQSTSWQQYHDHVRDFSLGLISLGLERGDKVAIIGNNRPEWVYAELAAQGAGAVSAAVLVGVLAHTPLRGRDALATAGQRPALQLSI